MSESAGSGFTLIEMAAALAVTGLVVAAGYAGLSVLSGVRADAGGSHSRVLAATNARATLAGWLTSTTELVQASDRSAGAHPLDELVFVTSDGGELWPGPRRIRLRVDIDPATSPRGLVATLRPPGEPAGEADTVSLAPEAAGVEIRYRVASAEGPDWVHHPPDDDATVPSALRIRLVDSPRLRLGPGASERPAGSLAGVHELPLVVPLPTARR